MKKRIISMLLIIAFVPICVNPLKSEAKVFGEWVEQNGRWWFTFYWEEYAHSEYIDGCWLDADGWYDPAWDGAWCQDNKGWWFKSGSWYPKNMWLKIDRGWYYFDQDGYMVCNKLVDGCLIGDDGLWTGITFNISKTPFIITRSEGKGITNQEYINEFNAEYNPYTKLLKLTIKGKNLKSADKTGNSRIDFYMYRVPGPNEDPNEYGSRHEIIFPEIKKEGDSYTVVEEYKLNGETEIEISGVSYP